MTPEEGQKHWKEAEPGQFKPEIIDEAPFIIPYSEVITTHNLKEIRRNHRGKPRS
jgi:hypothetical protein